MPRDLALLNKADPGFSTQPVDEARIAQFRDLVRELGTDGDDEPSAPFLGVMVGLLVSAVMWSAISLAIWYLI